MNPYEDEVLGKAYDAKLMRRFFRYLKPYTGLVILSLVFILLNTVAILAGPLILKEAIDGPVENRDMSGLLHYGLIFIVSIVLVAVFECVQVYLTNLTGQKIIYDLRMQLFSHIQRLPTQFFDRNPVGRLVVRTTNDIENLNELFTSGLIAFFSDVLILLGVLVTMFIINWKLALAGLAVAPLIALGVVIFRKFAREKYREMRRKLARMNAYLSECVQGMRVIKSFNRSKYVTSKFHDMNEDFNKESLQVVLVYSVFFPFVELTTQISIAVIVWFGGVSILEGSLTFGQFLAFWYCITKIYEPLRDLSEKYNILQSAMASSERIFKILDTPQEVNHGNIRKDVAGSIEFRNVTFSYDGQINVLEDISFRIAPGEKVAVVGFTGAGKTTLVNLLTRHYELSNGQILVDGDNIKFFDLYHLRQNISIIHQDVFLFSRTVAENVTLGKNHENGRLDEAVKYVYADRFLSKLEKGHHTQVKERGYSFSAGERQLLSFARAIYFDPKIMILDEATSYVDPVTESLVQDATSKLIKDKTALIIAHRLSTIKLVDRILVLQKGRLVEVGTHDELNRKGGLYQKLYKLQFDVK